MVMLAFSAGVSSAAVLPATPGGWADGVAVITGSVEADGVSVVDAETMMVAVTAAPDVETGAGSSAAGGVSGANGFWYSRSATIT